MKSIPHLIKEALDYNNGVNQTSEFLRNYYRELLRIADTHHKIVQTNRDEGFIGLHKKYGDSIDKE